MARVAAASWSATYWRRWMALASLSPPIPRCAVCFSDSLIYKEIDVPGNPVKTQSEVLIILWSSVRAQHGLPMKIGRSSKKMSAKKQELVAIQAAIGWWLARDHEASWVRAEFSSLVMNEAAIRKSRLKC